MPGWPVVWNLSYVLQTRLPERPALDPVHHAPIWAPHRSPATVWARFQEEVLTAPPERSAAPIGRYTADRAEELLSSLVGIISARVVVDDDGTVDEIHVLSTSDVSAKQAVRNVESALRAHLDLAVDHRRISVAQAEPGSELEAAEPLAQAPREERPLGSRPVTTPPPPSLEAPAPRLRRFASHAEHDDVEPATGRFLFLGHQVTSQRAHRVETRVTLEWKGQRYDGTAWTPDLPKPRLEAMADATLRAMEQALQADDEHADSALSLEGVNLVEAFDRSYVLVSVQAVEGSRATALAGAVPVHENVEASVVLATLQATDRRIRGMIEEAPTRAPKKRPADPGFGDPFDIWG